MIRTGHTTRLLAAVLLFETFPSALPAAETKIRPGTIVAFKTATPACFTWDGLQEYLAHVAKGDRAKARAMLFESGGNQCITLPPAKKFKVISVEHNPGSSTALLQVVGADVASTAGTWTLSTTAVPVKR